MFPLKTETTFTIYIYIPLRVQWLTVYKYPLGGVHSSAEIKRVVHWRPHH